MNRPARGRGFIGGGSHPGRRHQHRRTTSARHRRGHRWSEGPGRLPPAGSILRARRRLRKCAAREGVYRAWDRSRPARGVRKRRDRQRWSRCRQGHTRDPGRRYRDREHGQRVALLRDMVGRFRDRDACRGAGTEPEHGRRPRRRRCDVRRRARPPCRCPTERTTPSAVPGTDRDRASDSAGASPRTTEVRVADPLREPAASGPGLPTRGLVVFGVDSASLVAVTGPGAARPSRSDAADVLGAVTAASTIAIEGMQPVHRKQ